jgi:hypothetical protein
LIVCLLLSLPGLLGLNRLDVAALVAAKGM